MAMPPARLRISPTPSAPATIPPASCKTKISFYLWVRNACGRFWPTFFTLSGKAVRVLPRPLRRSRASSPKGRADTPGHFTGQPGTVPPPLKPSPTGERWRVAPDEGQHQLPRRGSQGLKPIAKVLGIMRRLSAVLLALPLRKDFHPLRGKMSRSAFKIIPHKKAAAQNPVQQP